VAALSVEDRVQQLEAGIARPRRYAELVQRAMSGYHRDLKDDWVAELSCGHSQHIRHRPPFQLREWVLNAKGRHDRLGSLLDCPLCDRAELPDGLELVRTSPEWNERTIPAGLKQTHRMAAGTWGSIKVHDGNLRFTARTEPELHLIVRAGSTQAIPPEVEHEVQALDRVCFSIDILSVPEGRTSCNDVALQEVPGHGGETACWAHLLCPTCGVILDGGPHRDGCDVDAET
jgi:tellurite methyltransferase